MSGWIGVDLDGTLAFWDIWRGIEHIGKPIPSMVLRVKNWLAKGREVKIFTARACDVEAVPFIEKWCLEHLGKILPVTNMKDFDMIELWDDRAIRVRENSGETCCLSHRR
jgi:hypothetical protein